MQLYLIRHGETTSNSTGVHGKPTDSLSERGRKQAELVAKRFLTIPIELIISSTLERTKETTAIINAHLKKQVEFSDLIVERKYPEIILSKAKNDPEAIKLIFAMEKSYDTPDIRYAGAESFNDLKDRAKRFLDEVSKRKEEKILVVTHDMFMRFLVTYMMFGESITPREFIEARDFLRTKFTGITICRYEANPKPFGTPGWKLETWNDHTHLI